MLTDLTRYKGQHLTLEDVSDFIVMDDDIHLYYALSVVISYTSLNLQQLSYPADRAREYAQRGHISPGRNNSHFEVRA
jgi:hypothetical protein